MVSLVMHYWKDSRNVVSYITKTFIGLVSRITFYEKWPKTLFLGNPLIRAVREIDVKSQKQLPNAWNIPKMVTAKSLAVNIVKLYRHTANVTYNVTVNDAIKILKIILTNVIPLRS